MKSGASLRATSAVVSSRSRIPNLLSMTVAVGCTPRHESSPSLIFFRVCVCFPLFFSCSVPKSWMGNKTKSTKLILSDEHATVETCYYCVNYVCRGERECGKWIKDECSASVYWFKSVLSSREQNINRCGATYETRKKRFEIMETLCNVWNETGEMK